MNGDMNMNQQGGQPMGGSGNQMPMPPKTPSGNHGSQMWLVVVVVLLVVAVFGWLYYSGYFTLPAVEVSQDEGDALGISDVEDGLEDLNMEDLDSELSDIEMELESAQ